MIDDGGHCGPSARPEKIDLQTHTHDKKTDRMRSWYLYEQYKTLEQHQLTAAEQLRNRSVQERLLHQELTERRARRSLYDPSSVSEPKLDRSHDTCLSTTTDDFYESFCELHDFEADKDSLDDNSHHGSENTFMEDFKNLDEFHEDTSCADSVSSVVDKEVTNRSSAQRTITDNIKLHLQTVKKNMVSLERYAQMADGDHTSEASVDSLGWPKRKNVIQKNGDEHQLFYMWTRLVAFAYHIMQLNHGNCYYDYSSQVLTAVLACDALRRGVSRMCDILQYYVSPVKYVSDSEDCASNSSKNLKKKRYSSKNIRKLSKYKINSSLHKNVTKHFEDGRHVRYEVSSRQRHRKHSFVNKKEQIERIRQPNRGKVWSQVKRSSASGTLWPEELESSGCSRISGHVANPMLQLVRYLDDVLKIDVRDYEYI